MQFQSYRVLSNARACTPKKMITHLAIVIVADVCIVKICNFLLRHALSPNPKYVVVLRDLQRVLIETSYDETDTRQTRNNSHVWIVTA